MLFDFLALAWFSQSSKIITIEFFILKWLTEASGKWALFVGLRNTKVRPLDQIGLVGHTYVSTLKEDNVIYLLLFFLFIHNFLKPHIFRYKSTLTQFQQKKKKRSKLHWYLQYITKLYCYTRFSRNDILPPNY